MIEKTVFIDKLIGKAFRWARIILDHRDMVEELTMQRDFARAQATERLRRVVALERRIQYLEAINDGSAVDVEMVALLPRSRD